MIPAVADCSERWTRFRPCTSWPSRTTGGKNRKKKWEISGFKRHHSFQLLWFYSNLRQLGRALIRAVKLGQVLKIDGMG